MAMTPRKRTTERPGSETGIKTMAGSAGREKGNVATIPGSAAPAAIAATIVQANQ